MPASDDPVDLGLGVASSWLEIFDQPSQDGQALLVLRRDCEEPARRIHKVLQNAGIEFVHLLDRALHRDLIEAEPVGQLV